MLEQNSEQMKTVVETFLEEETVSMIYDNEKLEKWNKLISEIGLEGQTKIVKPEKSPIPFMHLKTSLKHILQQLCPRDVKIEEFNISPIPLEILDLVALSKRERYFNEIKIWYDDKDPDPVCVGITCQYYTYDENGKRTRDFATKQEAMAVKHPTQWDVYSTNTQYYLIGKWGDVKRSFEELRDMAIKRFIGSQKNEIDKQMKRLKRELEDVENTAYDRFS